MTENEYNNLVNYPYKSEQEKCSESYEYFYIKYLKVPKGDGTFLTENEKYDHMFNTDTIQKAQKDYLDLIIQASKEGKNIRLLRGRSRDHIIIEK